MRQSTAQFPRRDDLHTHTHLRPRSCASIFVLLPGGVLKYRTRRLPTPPLSSTTTDASSVSQPYQT